MQFISCHDGKLQTLAATGLKASAGRAFVTGVELLDSLPPAGAFARGAVHELLFAPRDGEPRFVAALLASAASVVEEPSSLSPVIRGAGRAAREAAKPHLRERARNVPFSDS